MLRTVIGFSSERDREFDRIKSCAGKRQYETRSDAQSDAKRVKSMNGWAGLRAYKCLHCEYYHIGHQPKRTKRVKR